MKLTSTIALLTLATTDAFVPSTPSNTAPLTRVNATPLSKLTTAITTASIAIATSPLVAIAADEDGYEYGAVAAPGGIGLAVGLGVVAILTAAVPVILAPGEDAFNEMKERDESKWGK
mmetsp:Transcript_12187/g.26668  ORF Transcript_12187/g.26668 Transcript_12187/m.26668 type:complete len:118 (+) Transcript_12187:113-466(+)|eukprot:g7494.t1 g7494   contig24:747185-747745(-)